MQLDSERLQEQQRSRRSPWFAGLTMAVSLLIIMIFILSTATDGAASCCGAISRTGGMATAALCTPAPRESNPANQLERSSTR
ncbi:hypothetical protein [Desulfogranum mediterraneum]|uniref:hypothetical protein n=1 Tax=Desulfogranum mediterraneum TaxID=160661 RepID=UPI00040C7B49|nr:hypothetical protein [Desulfogranum mediterraneum]